MTLIRLLTLLALGDLFGDHFYAKTAKNHAFQRG